MKKAIYPGSFNPLHQGHISIVNKALMIFDLIYIVVTKNPDKNIENNYLLNQKIIQNTFKNNPKIIVLVNESKLTAILAQELGASFLIRSSRTNIDFEYELMLANANNYLNHQLETILLFPDYEHHNVSSTITRHKKNIKNS